MAYADHIVVDGAQYDLRDKEAVLFEAQTLTAAQQAQARENIGAGSAEDVEALVDKDAGLETYVRGMSPLATLSGALVAVPDAAPLDAEDVLVNIEPVQSGSGDPSPDNVRPITGWTGATVFMAGKNLLDTVEGPITTYGVTATKNPDGTFSMSGTATGLADLYLRRDLVLPPGRYVFSGGVEGLNGTGNSLYISIKDESGAIRYIGIKSQTFTSFTLADGEYIASCFIRVAKDTNANGFTIAPMICLASETDPTYEPYTGETYSIAFPSEAGTVYGGTLDVTKGLLMVERGMVDLGTLAWNYSDTSRHIFRTAYPTPTPKAPESPFVATSAVCEQYHAMTFNAISASSDGAFALSNSRLVFIDHRYTTVDDFKTAVSGVKLVYELATPVTYQLDPVAVALLQGQNTLWADTGDTALTYRQDVGLLLEALLRPDETDMTADTNYAVNSFFTVGGTLYRATAAIATGETIVPGTNCVPTTIADQLTAIYAQL